jgi:hypothetical protein
VAIKNSKIFYYFCNITFKNPIIKDMKKLFTSFLFVLPLIILPGTCAEAQSKSPFTYEFGNTSIKLGGFIRAVAYYDFDGSIQNSYFIVSGTPNPSNWEYSSKGSFEMSDSRLSLKITQKTEKLGDVELYFEGDFRGASDVFRLRHAYLSFLGFVAGQTWSFWYDPSSTPQTIDIQGVNSRTFYRIPLFGYTTNIGKNLSFGIALELPKSKITAPSGYKTVNQVVPDIPVYLQYKAKRGHIKAAAVYRSLSYGIPSDTKIKSRSGFGAQLSGSLKISKPWTLYSNAIYGRGIARYINDLAALSLDLVPDNSNASIQAIPMWGMSLGTKVDLSKSMFYTGSYSVAGMNGKYNYYSATEYLKGNYFSSSLFWKITPEFTAGCEYLHGTRENMNRIKADANRMQVILTYSF